MDPREERSAHVLRDALFELARTRDIATVTATELARHTGLARRTIYNHGQGPRELLFGYLAEELTAIRDEFAQDAGDHSARENFEAGLQRVLDHVETHRDVYTRAVSATSSPAWHHLLTQHFTVSLALFESIYQVRAPELGDDTDGVIASSLAHGMVGAIEAWLRLDGAPDAEFCHRVVMAIVPRWFLGE